MTKEEAKNKALTEAVQHKNGLKTIVLRKVNKLIDKLCNEHEAKIKAKDEEIEMLKRDLTAWSMLYDEPQDNKL